MYTDNHGRPIFVASDIKEELYKNNIDKFHSLQFEYSVQLNIFNKLCEDLNIEQLFIYEQSLLPEDEFHASLQQEWFCPPAYLALDLEEYLLDRCSTEEEKTRVVTELQAFEERKLGNLLRYTIYLVYTMREHGVLWGVGRGSSVASFVLYLIGVHRINPLEYDLDWQDFLR